MNVKIKMAFRTSQPLSQDAGMRFWSEGEHFVALPGRSTYQLTTSGEAEDLVEAVEAVKQTVEKIVAAENFRWDGVEVIEVSAQLLS